jgi:hypothetical protein
MEIKQLKSSFEQLKETVLKAADATGQFTESLKVLAKSVTFAQRYSSGSLTDVLRGECPPEVDAVEQLAAVTDPEVKKRVEFKKLAREIWLTEERNRKRMQAETARNYAALDAEKTLSMYENYAEMDKYTALGLALYADDAKPVRSPAPNEEQLAATTGSIRCGGAYSQMGLEGCTTTTS